jgi:hypothetical protein
MVCDFVFFDAGSKELLRRRTLKQGKFVLYM